ncbi:MAG TPA: hypothetical protein VMC78_10125 [Mycobacterium sp.]|nr:hypothetical protein [Mycobacterium sp.]
MSAAIWVVLILLAIGIVVESLLRLRKYLNSAPPGHDIKPPADGGAE